MPENYDLNDELFSFPPKGKENPFAVPGDYFETLPAKVLARIDVLEELKELPVLSSVQKGVEFSTPENYFEAKAATLENTFERGAFAVLKSVDVKKAGVEEEYFEALGKKMALRLELADELKAYDRLHAIDKQNNFAVD